MSALFKIGFWNSSYSLSAHESLLHEWGNERKRNISQPIEASSQASLTSAVASGETFHLIKHRAQVFAPHHHVQHIKSNQ